MLTYCFPRLLRKRKRKRKPSPTPENPPKRRRIDPSLPSTSSADPLNTVLLPHAIARALTWDGIQKILSSPDLNSPDLASPERLLHRLRQLNPQRFTPEGDCSSFESFFTTELGPGLQNLFFTRLLPAMCQCALKIKTLFPLSRPLHILRRQREPVHELQGLVLTREQVCCLLCHCFFCTMPQQPHLKTSARPNDWKHFDFVHFYTETKNISLAHQKLKCFVNYFYEMLLCQPDYPGSVALHRNRLQETVTFERWVLGPNPGSAGSLCDDDEIIVIDEEIEEEEEEGVFDVNRNELTLPSSPSWIGLLEPDWGSSRCPLIRFPSPEICHHGNMQDYKENKDPSSSCEDPTVSTVDFANRHIGGGVFTRGAVQEEILFLTHPECCVSRLFTESLAHRECVIIKGAARFTRHEGYRRTFRSEIRFAAEEEEEEVENDSRIVMEFLVMDATDFSKRSDRNRQFEVGSIVRELNKAFVSFAHASHQTIVTGNWGGGVFGGDHQLKALIQLMAAACVVPRKRLVYYARAFQRGVLERFVKFAFDVGLTVGETFGFVIRYFDERASRSESILEFLERAHGASSWDRADVLDETNF